MDGQLGAQLITAGSTLSGVVLTLLATAFLDRRRAADGRALEAMKLRADQSRWLRDERRRAYSALSAAGEEALQFLRNRAVVLIDDRSERPGLEGEWAAIRTDLRKAFNQVELLGTGTVRMAALTMWRAARDGGNDFFASLDGEPGPPCEERREWLRATRSEMGTLGDTYLKACRDDLQAGTSD